RPPPRSRRWSRARGRCPQERLPPATPADRSAPSCRPAFPWNSGYPEPIQSWLRTHSILASGLRVPLPATSSALLDEGPDRLRDQLNGDRRQQQPGDPRDQLHAAGPQNAVDHPGKTHSQPQDDGYCHDRNCERRYVRRTVRPPDEQHRSDDCPRPGQQRRAERYEGHVGLQPLGLGRLRHRTGHQLQRDEQEQQAAGPLQRRELHTQVGQDGLAEYRKSNNYPERDHGGLPRQPVTYPRRQAFGQAEERRHDTRRIGDHQQGDENLPEEPQVENGAHRAPGPGPLSPGSLSPGSLSPGSLSPGSLSPGSLSPGSLSPGSFKPGPRTGPGPVASARRPSDPSAWAAGQPSR